MQSVFASMSGFDSFIRSLFYIIYICIHTYFIIYCNCTEENKLMTNNTSGINTEIKVNGQKLETVTSFKYLGSIITDEGSKTEMLSRIAQTTAALTRLKPV